MVIAFMDNMPIWTLFIITVFLALVFVEIGFKLGRFRRKRSDQELPGPVGTMVVATLGLLAFVLAFTFGMAASRHETRRQLVLDEANAVTATFLRAELFPQPYRLDIQNMLREYVDRRLEAIANPEKLSANITRSEELHRLLWKQTAEVVEKHPNPINGLFITSLNTVIEIHAKRIVFSTQNRIPIPIWIAQYVVAFLAMMSVGYHTGLSGSRRSIASIFQAVAFSAVLMLIADLDDPQKGQLNVGQEAMVKTQSMMRESWR